MFLFIPRQKFHFPTLCQSVKLFPPSSTFVPFVIQSCNNYWQTETIFVQRNYVTCAKKDSFFFFSFFHERSLFNVFTYSSRGFPWFSRTTRPRHSVKGKYTPRSSRSRLNRSRTHTARRSFLEWQICLALSALSPYSKAARGPRGEETSTSYVALVPSFPPSRTAFLCVTRKWCCHNTAISTHVSTGSPGNASRPHFDYQRGRK